MYVTGALALETASVLVDHQFGARAVYLVVTGAEEFAEMSGIALLLATLLAVAGLGARSRDGEPPDLWSAKPDDGARLFDFSVATGSRS